MQHFTHKYDDTITHKLLTNLRSSPLSNSFSLSNFGPLRSCRKNTLTRKERINMDIKIYIDFQMARLKFTLQFYDTQIFLHYMCGMLLPRYCKNYCTTTPFLTNKSR